jgi:hypothetical protein
LTDVRLQSFDLMPQWMPQSGEITATGTGKTLRLDATQPVYGTPATPSAGLDVEAVWIGTGTEADYMGRHVKGKAIFLTRGPQTNLGIAEERGAAAVFIVNQLPGNIRIQNYPVGTKYRPSWTA